MKNKQKESSCEYIDSLNKYTESRINEKRLKPIVTGGLELLYSLPSIDHAIYYSFNESELDFELFYHFPEEECCEDLLDKLMDAGIITKALQAKEIIFYKSEEYDLHVSVLSLTTLDGKVFGLIVNNLNSEFEKDNEDIKRKIKMICYNMGNSIESLLLSEQNRKTNELLDQAVASKTMEIEKSMQSLGNKLELLTSNLILSIPHEVRTPINQILGFTKFLRDYYISEDNENYDDIQEILGDITSSTERLKRLFENYIFYTNLVVLSNDIKQLKKIREQITPSASSLVFEKAMTKAYLSGRKNDVEIDIPDAPVMIEESYFMKVIDEIMDNSLKYSEKGTAIKISGHVENELYHLIIRDHGVGISDEDIKKIGTYMQFERKSMEQQGIGLGLAIVLKILSLNKGKLDIKSRKDEYTETIIILPIAKMSKY